MPKRRSLQICRIGRSAVALGAASLITFILVTQVGAHFLLNLNVRIFHVDHVQSGLIVHMRTPMPYLVADKLGATGDADLPDPAPFTSNAREGGQLVHFVDRSQIAGNPLGIGRIAEDGLLLMRNGSRLRGTIEAVSVHAVGREPPFAALGEARSAFERPFRPADLPDGLYVGDAVVDVKIHYETQSAVEVYSISSQLNPDLPGLEQTANLILDYGPGEPKVYRSRGLLTEPIEVSRSRLAAIGTFVWEGVRHILEGLDHVLFVVCLVLGANSLRRLLVRVTGFTIGHSVTLALGFFGFVPGGNWFVPAVEAGISVSIVYAGILVFRRRPENDGSELAVFFVTLLIGLLHGLGFSFVLREILQVTAPNIWQSLLAFNIGVELGQVLIVLAIWPLLNLMDRYFQRLSGSARMFTAIACIAIAFYWTVERTMQLAGSVG